MFQHCAFLGSGAMATGLSVILGQKGVNVSIWSRSEEQAKAMRDERENKRQLPGITIPDNVAITSDIDEALKEFVSSH